MKEKFTLYRNITDIKGFKTIDIDEWVQQIKTPVNGTVEKIRKIRDTYELLFPLYREILKKSTKLNVSVTKFMTEHKDDKSVVEYKKLTSNYGKLKEKLPNITVSGVFNQRNSTDIKTFSNLMQIDIDHKDNVEFLDNPDNLQKIKDDKYSYIYFTSPNGRGIKLFVKIDCGFTVHEWKADGLIETDDANTIRKKIIDLNTNKIQGVFNKLEKYYADTYGVKIDTNVKDLGRVCYISHDPDVIKNDKAETIKFVYKPETVAKKTNSKTETVSKTKLAPITNSNDANILYKMLDYCEQNNRYIVNGYDRKEALMFIICDAITDDTERYEIFDRFTKIGAEYPPAAFRSKMKSMIDKFNRDKGVEKIKKWTIKTVYYWAKEVGIKLTADAESKMRYNINDLPGLIFDFLEYETTEALVRIDRIKQRMLVYDPKNKLIGDTYGTILDCKVLTDGLLLNLRGKVNSKYGVKFNIGDYDAILKDNGYIKEFDIVKGWLEKADATKTAEYETEFNKFIDMIPTDDKIHAEKCIKSFMLGTFGNLFDLKSGVFNKILIFQGEQQIGKTPFIRRIFGKFFDDNNLIGRWERTGNNKDDVNAACRNVWMLDDELDSITKFEIEKIKKDTSWTTGSMRQAYARYDSDTERNASYIGTTNNNSIFSDYTGVKRWMIIPLNGRFDCIEVEEKDGIFVPILDENGQWIYKIDTDVIWWYMWLKYKKGERYENYVIDDAVAERYRNVTLEEEWLTERLTKSEDFNGNVLDIIKLFEEEYRGYKLSTHKIGALLKKLGYDKKQVGANRVQRWNCMLRPTITDLYDDKTTTNLHDFNTIDTIFKKKNNHESI